MRLDETLRLRLVTSQGSPYPSRSPRRLVSYTPLAPLATGTAFIYLDVFDRAVDICRQRSCANCCSSPALAELKLLASAAHTWQCARAAAAAAAQHPSTEVQRRHTSGSSTPSSPSSTSRCSTTGARTMRRALVLATTTARAVRFGRVLAPVGLLGGASLLSSARAPVHESNVARPQLTRRSHR